MWCSCHSSCAVAAMSHAMPPLRHWGSRPGLTKRRRRSAAQRRLLPLLLQQLQQSQPIKCASCGCSRVAIELAAQHRLFRAALSAASRRVVPESHMVCDYELTRLECRCAPDDGTDADNVPLAAHIFISSTTATTCNNNS